MRKTIICALIVGALHLGALWISARAQSQAAASPQQALVTLNMRVTDSSGRSITDLRKEDLQLFDEGNLETISHFSKEDLPITYGLVIDASGSLKPHFRPLLEASQQIIAANRPNDETFIVRFVTSNNIQVLQELTSDKETLKRALSGLKIEMGQTALIDALYIAAQYAIEHRKAGDKRHFALVLISDGEDRASYYRENQLFELLKKSNLQVFIVGLIGELEEGRSLVRKSPRQTATDFINKLAQETGGQAFILSSTKEISDVTLRVTEMLGTRYVIGYTPTTKLDKLKRKVQVKLIKSPESKKWRVSVGKVEVNTSRP
jgi:Ca-activated chloride channel family protein